MTTPNPKFRFDPSRDVGERYFYVFEEVEYHNARLTDCGRFEANPADIDLTESEADELDALNAKEK